MTQWINLGDLTDRSQPRERPAIIDLRVAGETRVFSHGEIDDMANRVASFLVARGLKRGARVAILAFNRAEYMAAFFGTMRAGMVTVPVNIKLPRDTIDYVLRDSAVELAFVDEAHRDATGAVPAILFDEAPFTDAGAPDFTTVVPAPGEIAEILYTSGSTGRPKGVPLTHDGQLWVFREMQANKAASWGGEVPRAIVVQPLFHMNGLYQSAGVFAGHASVVMMPTFSSRAYLEAIAANRVTSITAVPTMMARAFKEVDLLERLDFSAVNLVRVGSAPVTIRLLDQMRRVFPNAAVANGYGTTEGGAMVFGPHPEGKPRPLLSVGCKLASVDLRLVDGPSADEGVLEMHNPAVMPGYLNLPEASAKVLRDGWYRSGDVFRRDEDGFYFFVGRADDMFVCSAENIYPGEVEKMLERHEGIHQAAVVPIPDEERGQIPVAFIVPAAGASLDADAVKTFALKNGPAYQHPRRVAIVTDLPWAGTNKIDRKALINRANALEAEGGWTR
jgi:acyl-CoA synthetase (AMP-forming)/AMP-acid ligase II